MLSEMQTDEMYFVFGGAGGRGGVDVWLPLSAGLLIPVNLLSAGIMVCRWDDVVGSVSQNAPEVLQLQQKILPVKQRVDAYCSCLHWQPSPHLMLQLSPPVL